MKSRTTLLAVGAAIALLTGAVAPVASAAPYDGSNPATTGCANTAVVVATANVVNPQNGAITGVAELRYSTSCQTNWVRVNNYVSGATAIKNINRLASSGYGAFSQSETDSVTGWSYGMQAYAPGATCISWGGFITLNGQQIGSTGQSPIVTC